MPPDPRPIQAPEPSDPAELALWQAELVACNGDPWRASLFMRRLGGLRSRLAELLDWLASLPRRLRRGWARAWGRRWASALPAAALLLALAAGQVRAATITVDPGGSGCTLDDAIVAANTDTATGSCPAGAAGADTISFANANGTYLLDTNYGVPLPTINSAITIQGNGNTTLDAEGMFRVLTVDLGGSLGIANATITGGSAGTDGGGIYVAGGTLSLTSATISGNTASDRGGGIYAGSSTVSLTSTTISGNSAYDRGGGIYARSSMLSLTRTTISGNTTSGLGGGIAAFSGGSLSLTSATISGNSANGGGGVWASASTSVQNATISGNSAGNRAGGIYICCNTLVLTHATITGNSATFGAGGVVGVSSALINSQSSIIAGQAAGADCGVDGNSSIASNGYNIESATSCGFSMASDQQNVSPAALDLDPLMLNAPGTTETHALGAGSAALDQIPPGMNGCGTSITTDQRGVTRPQGTNCDVGAYELEVAMPTPLPTSTPVPPTAAEVTHFAAAPDPTGRIRITWETASEVDVAGFRLQRTPEGSDAWADVGALVPARGSATGGAGYGATDAPGVGSFAYRLVVVNADGPPATHGPVGAVVRALRAFLPVGWR